MRSRVIKSDYHNFQPSVGTHTQSFNIPLQTQQLSSRKCMWWKQAENALQDFVVYSTRKIFSEYGESRHHPYFNSAINTQGVIFLMQYHHLMSPALSCLSMEALSLTHFFHFPLRKCLCQHCMWWKNHKPNQGNRYEGHKQLYQNPLQLSPASLGYTQVERWRPFLRPQGIQKLTTNQTFHLVPEQNNLCEKCMHYSSQQR